MREDFRALKGVSDTYSAAAKNIIDPWPPRARPARRSPRTPATRLRCCSTSSGCPKAESTCSAPSKDNLVKAVNLLEPTTNLLMKYNPELTCLFVGAKTTSDTGYADMLGGNGKSLDHGCRLLFGRRPLPVSGQPADQRRQGRGGRKPGCGSLPDVAKNFPVRQLITNTGFGTGLDLRPNPGIGFPGYANYFPARRGPPRDRPSIRYPGGPAPGPCRTRARRPTARRIRTRTERRSIPVAARATTGPAQRPGIQPPPVGAASCPRTPGTPTTHCRSPPWYRPIPASLTPKLEKSRTVQDNLRGVLWRLGIFAVVCALGTFALFAVFAQLRFEKASDLHRCVHQRQRAEERNFVRIAGVEVGKVKNISVQHDSTVQVEFCADDSVVLTEGSRAVIRYDDLIGGRYLALEEGAGGTKKLGPGTTIPLSRHRAGAGSGRRDRWVPATVPRT